MIMRCISEYYDSDEECRMKFVRSPREFNNATLDSGAKFTNAVYFYPPYKTDAEKKLRVFGMGHESCFPGKKIINRSFSNALVFHYVVKGQCIYNGNTVKRGSVFINYPKYEHTIININTDPMEMYWIIFDGSEIPQIIEKCGISHNNLIMEFDHMDDIVKLFNMAVYEYNECADAFTYYYGCLQILLSYHLGLGAGISYEPEETRKLSVQENYIKHAMDIIKENNYCITIEKVASEIGITGKYLGKLFLEQYGETLQSYIMNVKLENARIMLQKNSGIMLKNMYELFGYSDYVSFSRAFKQKYGVSPRRFIADNIGNIENQQNSSFSTFRKSK